MSARQKIEKTCVLCYQTHKDVEGDTHGWKIADQIFVVFLMRNVLEIPKSFCENLLVKKGNPSEWISCCPPCSKTIHNLHKVFLQLKIIQKKYDLLKQKVKLILESSKAASTPNCVKTITPRQNDSANEIRSFIFSARHIDVDKLSHQNVTYDQVIKLDPNELLEIKAEAEEIDLIEDETFYQLEEDNHDSFEKESDVDISKQKVCTLEIGQSCALKKKRSYKDEDSHQVFNLDSFEKKSDVDITNFKKEGCAQERRKTPTLRQRKKKKSTIDISKKEDCSLEVGQSRALKKKRIYKDEDSSSPASVEMDCGDSEWECGNVVENIESENSEDERRKLDAETKTVLPRRKRRRRARKSDNTKNTDRNVETKLSCLECEETFTFVYQLTLHNRNTHGKKYTCGICDSAFKCRSEAMEHFKTAHPTETPKFRTYKEVEDINCELCGVFLKARSILKHMQEVHVKPKCDICNKMCQSYCRLKIHRRGVHFKELNLEPYQCKICQKILKSPRNVKDHMTAKHTHDYRVFCPICKVGSKDQSSLNIHIRRKHTDDRPFACQFCEKRCATKSDIENHEIVYHTKEYKFNCDICSKGFLSHAQLNHHKLIYHTNASKPFECELCSSSFNTKYLLADHRRGHHYKELNLEPFQCNECGKIFKSGCSILKKHMIQEHTKAFDFTCSECGKQYVTQGLLDKHIRVQHKKEAECLCTVCGKAYFTKQALTSHIQRYHTKEFTHKCTLCPDRGYSDNWGLKRHMQMKHPDMVHETGTS